MTWAGRVCCAPLPSGRGKTGGRCRAVRLQLLVALTAMSLLLGFYVIFADQRDRQQRRLVVVVATASYVTGTCDDVIVANVSKCDVISAGRPTSATTASSSSIIPSMSSVPAASRQTLNPEVAEFWREMRRRRRVLRRSCSSFCADDGARPTDTLCPTDRDGHDRTFLHRRLSDGRRPYTDSLIVDPRRRVLYCAVPKVASSTVKTVVAAMTGQLRSPPTGNRSSDGRWRSVRVHDQRFMSRLGLMPLGHYLAGRRRATRNRTAAAGTGDVDVELKRLRKFVVVRDPMRRLVSAYRDKFEQTNRWNDYFDEQYGRLIAQRYGGRRLATGNRTSTGAGGATGSGSRVTFEEFSRFVVDEAELGRLRTFNPHWSPYVELCHPCVIHYDFVIRLENFDAESALLWSVLYPEEQLPEGGGGDVDGLGEGRRTRTAVSGQLRTLRRNANVNRTTDDVVVSRYLSSLSAPLRRRLFDHYDLDFRLFGYATPLVETDRML